MEDEKGKAAVKVNGGFTAGVEKKQVILRRHFFILQNVGAGGKLFFRHRVGFVGGAPNADRFAARLTGKGFYFLHLLYVGNVDGPFLVGRKSFQDLTDAGIADDGFVLILPQGSRINRNGILRTGQTRKRFWRGGHTNDKGFAAPYRVDDGIAGNLRIIGLGFILMERGENDKVMDFVAENDLKERGKIRIVLCPNAELGVGGNDPPCPAPIHPRKNSGWQCFLRRSDRA